MDSKRFRCLAFFAARKKISLLMAIVCGLPIVCSNNHKLYDLVLYHLFANNMWHGLWPYRDFGAEYPPLALALMSLPGLLSLELPRYAALFLVMMAGFDALQKVSLYRLGRRGLWAMLALSILEMPLYITHLKRFDVAAASLVTLALLRLTQRPHSLVAPAILGFAAALKLYPLILVAPALLFLWRSHIAKRRLVLHIMVGLTAFLVPFVCVVAAIKEPALGWLSYHQARGLHIPTTYTAVALLQQGLGSVLPRTFAFGAAQVNTPWADSQALWAPYVMAVALATTTIICAWRLRGSQGLYQSACALIAALFFTTKTLSPQYVLWLVPLVALAATQGTPRRDDLFVLGLIVALLTGQLFPGEVRLADGEIKRQVYLVTRQLCFVLLWLASICRGALFVPRKGWLNFYVDPIFARFAPQLDASVANIRRGPDHGPSSRCAANRT